MYYIIDFSENVFTLDFSEKLDREIFSLENDYLNSLHIHYSSKYNARIIDKERIDEVTLLFGKAEKEYKLTKSAIDQLVIIQETLYSKETKFFRNRSLDFSILNPNIKLFDFQIEDINWNLRRSAYFDANDAGLGKTPTNIITAAQNYKEGLIDAILIVCPGYLCFQWESEILDFVNVFKKEDIQIINNDSKFQPFTTFKDKKVIIISNHAKVFGDALLSYKKGFKFGDSLTKVKWKLFRFSLRSVWDKKNIMLIADESHCFIHSSAARTKALKKIKPDCQFRALLSATPNINRFENIYTQLNIVDKSLIPYSEDAFKLTIADELDRYGGVSKYNTDKIITIKKGWVNNFRQRLKKDVPEMKAQQFIRDIKLQLSKEQMILYKLLIEQELHILQEEHDKITWKLLLSKFHLINEIFNNAELLKSRTYSNEKLQKAVDKWSIDKDPKFKALTEYLENYIDNLGEKVVLYDYRPNTLNTLYEKFKKYNPQMIHGSLEGIKDKNLDRKQKEDIFKNDDSCKLFLLSSLTSSAGLNLQKSCHRIVVYSMDDDATHFRQLIDRTHRIVSIEDTIIDIFYYPDTIENLKIQRNLNRVELNDKLGKEISQEELERLINGRI